MEKGMLDLYTDYLITQNHYATATGLSDLLNGSISHDKVTRFLRKSDYGSKQLWDVAKPLVREIETDDGVLCFDDTVAEKAHTDENEMISWHYCHAKGRIMKGINLLSGLVRYGDVAIPIGFELVKKDVRYFDSETNRYRRKASISKNEHFRAMVRQAIANRVKFKYVLADNWFSSKQNLAFLQDDAQTFFIVGIKSNRTVALSARKRSYGQFQQLRSLELE